MLCCCQIPCLPWHTPLASTSTGCTRVKVSPSQRCVPCTPAVSSAEDARVCASALPSPHSEQELGELQHRREEWQARLSEVVEGTREEDLTLQMEQARWAAANRQKGMLCALPRPLCQPQAPHVGSNSQQTSYHRATQMQLSGASHNTGIISRQLLLCIQTMPYLRTWQGSMLTGTWLCRSRAEDLRAQLLEFQAPREESRQQMVDWLKSAAGEAKQVSTWCRKSPAAAGKAKQVSLRCRESPAAAC